MLHLYTWRDCLEILFFSVTVYRLIMWLEKDTKKSLISYFFGYFTTLGIAYLMQLGSVCALMLIYAPVIMTLFIILHEHTIQRNFITPQHVTVPQNTKPSDWLGTIISISLHRMNEGKPIICILEHLDNIAHYVKTPFYIDTSLQTELLMPLIHDASYKDDTMIWITSHGSLRGINTWWRNSSLETEIDTNMHLDYALALTSRSDCLLFYTNPTTRTFSVVARGTLFEKLPVELAVNMIKQHVVSPHKTSKGQYEKSYTKETLESSL